LLQQLFWLVFCASLLSPLVSPSILPPRIAKTNNVGKDSKNSYFYFYLNIQEPQVHTKIPWMIWFLQNSPLDDSRHISFQLSRYSDQVQNENATRASEANLVLLDPYNLQYFEGLGAWKPQCFNKRNEHLARYQPTRKVNGLQITSNTPGISHMRITTKKQAIIFAAMTDPISLYLLKIPRAA